MSLPLTKRSFDSLPYTVDFAPLLDVGESLASVAAVVIEPATTPALTAGTPVVQGDGHTVGFVLSAGKPTTTYTLRLRGTLAAAAGQVEATVALFVTDNIITT